MAYHWLKTKKHHVMLFCSESLNFPGLGPGSPFGISSATTSQEAAAWTHVSSWTSGGQIGQCHQKIVLMVKHTQLTVIDQLILRGTQVPYFQTTPSVGICAIEVAGEQFQHASPIQ
jgi:hypothetical protein